MHTTQALSVLSNRVIEGGLFLLVLLLDEDRGSEIDIGLVVKGFGKLY